MLIRPIETLPWPAGETKFATRDLILTGIQGKYTVTLIEGDGIGPEISQAVKDIFAAAKVSVPSQRIRPRADGKTGTY